MIATPWNLPLALVGVAVLIWLGWYLTISVRGHRWTASTTLVVCAAAVIMVPEMIGTFAHGIVSTTDVFGEPQVLYSPWVAVLQRYSLLLFFLATLSYVVSAVVRNRPLTTWAAPLLGLAVLVADIGNLISGAKVTDPPLLALAALLLAAGWARGPGGAIVGGVVSVVAVVGLSGLAGLAHANLVWKACREDKCGPAHALYQGLLVHENTMGLLVAMGIPFVVFGTRGRSRILLLGSLLLVEAATGSRTGLLAAVVATVGSLVLLVPTERSRLHLIAQATAWVFVAVGAVGSLAPLWVQESDQSFTARGELWRIARVRLFESPLWGHGSLGWRSIYSAEGLFGDSSTYSTHSQVLDVAFTAGGLGVLLVLVAVVLTLRQATPGQPIALALLLTILWLGGLERPWSFSGLDWLSWSLVAFVIAGQVVRPDPERATRKNERPATDLVPVPRGGSG